MATQAQAEQLAQQEQAYRSLREDAAREQLVEARAAYQQAAAEEDRLYAIYQACHGAPEVRDAARWAYLRQGSDVTRTLLALLAAMEQA